MRDLLLCVSEFSLYIHTYHTERTHTNTERAKYNQYKIAVITGCNYTYMEHGTLQSEAIQADTYHIDQI